jgi:hypothetical protein
MKVEPKVRCVANDPKAVALQGCQKSNFLFSVFGFVLLLCRLLCLMLFFNGVALVS